MIARASAFLIALSLAVAPNAWARPRSPRPILVVTAVDYEYDAVKGLLTAPKPSVLGGRPVTEGTLGTTRVVAIRAGWGKAQAAGATALAIARFAPRLVVMAGVAGGVVEGGVSSGDVVIAASTYQYDLGERMPDQFKVWPPETPVEKAYGDGSVFKSSAAEVKVASAAARRATLARWQLPSGCACDKDGRVEPGCARPPTPIGNATPRVCVGTIATADTFLADRATAQKLSRDMNVSAVDMETAAVAEEAANHGLPFVAVRVVGDTIGNGDNEGLYFCLKPQAGARLHDVMGQILTAWSAGAVQDAGPAIDLCHPASGP
jgi:adenosylhomocysteine nucleosidase